MVYTSNRDGGGSVPSGHLAHPPPEGRLRRTGIFSIYVKVDSSFDETGAMMPTALIWKNGKVYKIDSIRDYRPAASQIGKDLPGDCYTVVIGGQKKHLFFQKADLLFPSKIGRWFVMC